VRDTVAEDTASVKARAKTTYMALLAAQKEEADANNLKRHLREQLEILTAEGEEKKEVAVKADAIAKRMAAMAARADGAWQEVSKAKDKTEVGFKEAQATAKATAESEARAAKARREAEDQAQVASSKLAVADKKVRLLLEVRQSVNLKKYGARGKRRGFFPELNIPPFSKKGYIFDIIQESTRFHIFIGTNKI